MDNKPATLTEKERLRRLIQRLAQPGWVIRYDDEEYWLEGQREPTHGGEVGALIREGWLESFNGGYCLSDAGRKAYLRSTDELGSGELIAPKNT